MAGLPETGGGRIESQIMDNREIIDETLALPLTEGVEREVIERAKKRDLELQTGAVVGRSHQQVMEEARRALRGD